MASRDERALPPPAEPKRACGMTQGQNLLGFGQGYGFKQADALKNVGAMMQGQQQNVLDDAQQQFYNAQQRPLDLIGQFLGMINNGQIPSTGVPTGYMQNASANPMLSALQGGFGGGQMGASFGGFNPFQFGI